MKCFILYGLNITMCVLVFIHFAFVLAKCLFQDIKSFALLRPTISFPYMFYALFCYVKCLFAPLYF